MSFQLIHPKTKVPEFPAQNPCMFHRILYEVVIERNDRVMEKSDEECDHSLVKMICFLSPFRRMLRQVDKFQNPHFRVYQIWAEFLLHDVW